MNKRPKCCIFILQRCHGIMIHHAQSPYLFISFYLCSFHCIHKTTCNYLNLFSLIPAHCWFTVHMYILAWVKICKVTKGLDSYTQHNIYLHRSYHNHWMVSLCRTVESLLVSFFSLSLFKCGISLVITAKRPNPIDNYVVCSWAPMSCNYVFCLFIPLQLFFYHSNK